MLWAPLHLYECAKQSPCGFSSRARCLTSRSGRCPGAGTRRSATAQWFGISSVNAVALNRGVAAALAWGSPVPVSLDMGSRRCVAARWCVGGVMRFSGGCLNTWTHLELRNDEITHCYFREGEEEAGAGSPSGTTATQGQGPELALRGRQDSCNLEFAFPPPPLHRLCAGDMGTSLLCCTHTAGCLQPSPLRLFSLFQTDKAKRFFTSCSLENIFLSTI